MNATIQSIVMLLGLLVSLDVSAVETPDTSGKENLASCVENGLSLRVVEGDTLSEIARRVVSPEFQSSQELEQHLYECNPDAFGDSRDELVTGKILYLPIPNGSELLTEQFQEKPRPPEMIIPKPTDATLEIDSQPTENSEIPRFTDQETTGSIAKSESPYSSLLLAVLGLICFLALLLVALIVYLYRWSKMLRVAPVESPTFVPASSDVVQQNVLTQTLAELRALIAGSMEQIGRDSANNEEKLGTLRNIYVTLHGALDEKDAEIRRLKKGYDAQVFRKFLIRFIRTDLAVNDFVQDVETKSEALDLIKRLLEDALDECGVERFSPAIGGDYRRAEGVADNPRKTLSHNVDDRYKIAEVIEQGYRMKTPDGYEIVYPAKVRIFTTQ